MRVVLLVAALLGAAGVFGPLRAAREESAGLAALQRADLGAAERHLLTAARRSPSTRPELRLAQAYLFAGRGEDAARILRRVVAAEPRNAAAWRNLFQATGEGAARERYAALTGR